MFDAEGKFLRKIPCASDGDSAGHGKLFCPFGLATDSADNWVVCDGSHRVHIFTSDGRFITAFGEGGRRPGQFRDPISACVDSSGCILVGDGSYRVQAFAFAAKTL